jgi:hypothetical protein
MTIQNYHFLFKIDHILTFPRWGRNDLDFPPLGKRESGFVLTLIIDIFA